MFDFLFGRKKKESPIYLLRGGGFNLELDQVPIDFDPEMMWVFHVNDIDGKIELNVNKRTYSTPDVPPGYEYCTWKIVDGTTEVNLDDELNVGITLQHFEIIFGLWIVGLRSDPLNICGRKLAHCVFKYQPNLICK